MIGRTLSHYKVLEEISRGGMGIVYKALDLKLNREVALKVLPPELVSDPDRKRRFVQEAQAAAALKHPNIAVVYEIDEVDGVDFIVMELIEGETLSNMLRDGTIPGERAVEIAIGVASGLASAHEKRIVHRDLKPGNIMVTRDGHPKIIDFGLAKLVEPLGAGGSELETAVRAETRSGVLVGTVSYMSPEQALGQHVDARSDLFSLGVVLYEMTTGAKPFEGDTSAAVFDAILHRTPTPVRRLNEELPRELEQIISQLLEKEPGARFQSTEELLVALERSTATAPSWGIGERLKNPWWAVAALAAGVLLSILIVGMVRRSAGARWAREEALPEIARLVEEEEFTLAFELATEAEPYIPEDPVLRDLWVYFSRWISVKTEPAGADVSYAEYGRPAETWEHLGTTPIDAAGIPRGFFRWKIEKDGYETVETANFPWLAANNVVMRRTLTKDGELAPGMVKIEGKEYRFDHPQLETEERIDFDPYWLDRYEVTNRQYKQLVDAGGYRETDYWKHDFVKDGDALSWSEAMAELVDSTGRPGPSTWEAGAFPEGKDEHPVGGVSWYEAAAYCEFVGKRLPTLDHWDRAAGILLSDYILPASNFDGSATAPVGSYQSLGPEGTYDMAGNVKEWG